MIDIQYLMKFYDKLQNNLLYENKIKNNSVFTSMLEIKSNDRFRLLNDSSINVSIINKDDLKYYLEQEWIRPTEKINEYTITAKGIWYIEKNKGLLNEYTLVKHLDTKFFDFCSYIKPLNEKEKVILFSMIAARTFSDKSTVDLKRDETSLNNWKDILDKSFDKLKSLNIITNLKKDDLYGKKGNEHPVSHLIRHTDSLPKKTKSLFVAIRPQKYYLDIYKDSEFIRENLIYLISLLFYADIPFSTIKEIEHYCTEIAYDKSIFLFDLNDHIFINPIYDKIINNCIEKAYYG